MEKRSVFLVDPLTDDTFRYAIKKILQLHGIEPFFENFLYKAVREILRETRKSGRARGRKSLVMCCLCGSKGEARLISQLRSLAVPVNLALP